MSVSPPHHDPRRGRDKTHPRWTRWSRSRGVSCDVGLVMVIVVARIGRRLLSVAEFGHERRRRWRSAGARSALICPDHHRGRTRRGTGDGDDLEPHGISPRDPQTRRAGRSWPTRALSAVIESKTQSARSSIALSRPRRRDRALPRLRGCPLRRGARPTASRSWCSSTSFRRSPGRTRRRRHGPPTKRIRAIFQYYGISYLFAGSLEHLLRARFTPLTASASARSERRDPGELRRWPLRKRAGRESANRAPFRSFASCLLPARRASFQMHRSCRTSSSTNCSRVR